MKEQDVFQDLLWLTDLHVDMLPAGAFETLLAQLAERRPRAILIGGDMAVAQTIEELLMAFAEALPCPVHFVLGNHDYYGGGIQAVRARVAALSHPRLNYLSQGVALVDLGGGVALIGHDGWADGRYGDWESSPVVLNDYIKIAELNHVDLANRQWVDRLGLLRKLHHLGKEAGAHIKSRLKEAVQTHATTVLLTHAPPFHEACWHEGKISDDLWAPHFSCKAVGDAIMEVMGNHPERRLIVLCGHTHSPGVAAPLDNIEVYTGAAAYGETRIQNDLDWDALG